MTLDASILVVILAGSLQACTFDAANDDDRSRQMPEGWEGGLPEYADLAWTYRPSDPERKLSHILQPAVFGGRIYVVTRRPLTSPPADRDVEYSITAVDEDGAELWHAPMPFATSPKAPPMVDSRGHIWFFSQDAKEGVGRAGNYAYRISPDGRVLWGVSLQGAIDDQTPFTIGLRTAAAALDRHDNAYYVVGKSAASIDPDGKFRWGRLLERDDSEDRCGLRLFAPVVASDRVFFAEACTGAVVFDLQGNEVGRFDWRWSGTPMATPEGWLVAASGYEIDSGMRFHDYQGGVRLEWPAVTQNRDIVFGPQGTAFTVRPTAADVGRAEIVAWRDGEEDWSFTLDDTLHTVIASEDTSILLSFVTLGRMAIVDRHSGETVFDKALGRPGVSTAPVSAKSGEWAFLSVRSYEDDETVLTSVRAPIGPPASTAWSCIHANQRNSRSLDQ